MQLLNDLVGFAQTNQIFSGVAAAGGFASAIYWAREIPNRLARLVTWSISTEIEISNDSEAYQPFLEWMEAGGRAWHTRNFKISNRRSRAVPETGIAADQSEWTIAPGAGTHLIWAIISFTKHHTIGRLCPSDQGHQSWQATSNETSSWTPTRPASGLKPSCGRTAPYALIAAS